MPKEGGNLRPWSYENYSEFSNLLENFGGFVYDSLQWYLIYISSSCNNQKRIKFCAHNNFILFWFCNSKCDIAFQLVRDTDPNFLLFLLKFGLSEKHTKLCAIFLMLCTSLSKRLNHEEDFFKFCALLRKSKL